MNIYGQLTNPGYPPYLAVACSQIGFYILHFWGRGVSNTIPEIGVGMWTSGPITASPGTMVTTTSVHRNNTTLP